MYLSNVINIQTMIDIHDHDATVIWDSLNKDKSLL